MENMYNRISCALVLLLGLPHCAHWKEVSPTFLSGPSYKNFQGLQFSPNGKQIAVILADGDVLIWKRENFQNLGTPVVLQAFTDAFAYSHMNPTKPKPVSACWSKTGKYLVTASLGGTGILWNGSTGQRIGALPGEPQISYGRALSSQQRDEVPYPVAIDPLERWVAIGDDAGNVRFWKLSDQTLAYSLLSTQGIVRHILWSSDGNRLLTTGFDGGVTLWDLHAGTPTLLDTWPTGPVEKLSWSTDDVWVAASILRDGVQIRSLVTKQVESVPGTRETPIQTLSFSPAGGSHLLVAPQEGRVFVWDVTTMKKAQIFPESHVINAMYGPKGEFVLTAHAQGALHLRNSQRGSPLVVLQATAKQPIGFVAIHPLGLEIIGTGLEGPLRSWRLK